MADFDLCEAQEGLWYAQALDPDNPLFNTGQYIELTGPLDASAFARAHAAAMAEAEALRLRLRVERGRPRQSLGGDAPRLEIVDLRGAPDAFDRARERMERDSATPLDPARDPLAAFILFRLSDTHHLWYERIHHLAIDGFGMVLVTNRVGALYGAELGRKAPSPLAPFADALAADRAYRDSDQRAADAAFWRDYGATLGTPASPSAQAAPRRSAPRFLRRQIDVDPATFARLQTRATDLRIGWPDLLTLFTAAYLRRVSPDGDPVHGLPFMARFGTKAARVPCMWMNVLPYRFAIDEEEALDPALLREAAMLARLRKAGRYRSEMLRRDLGRTHVGDALYGPLINVQPYDIAPQFHGLDSRLHILGAGPVDDLTVSYRGDGKAALTVEIDANPDLYGGAEIEAHLHRLAAFLDRVVGADSLAPVPTVTEEEHRRLIHGLNATDHALPDTTLAALIEAQMRAAPEALAVIAGEDRLSYAELDRRSTALAERLVDMGAGRDRCVAVALERSAELSVALVAILRAGAAYVPLDPSQPPERLAGLIGQTQPLALLAAATLDTCGAMTPLPPADWPERPEGRARPCPAPDDLAYVLFTSGSTGAPKGVMIEHRAIVNRLLWMREHYGFSATDRILQKTPTTFDVSVWELFLPFLCGGTLVFAAPGAHRDPAAIAATIREHAVTVCHFVPSMLAGFLDHPASAGIAMRQVFCSGEALPAELRDRFHARIASELHNLYGPTEAAVDVTHWEASHTDTAHPLPIGWPVWNTRCYVLDPLGHPVPEGVAGELFLGGRQLARGYLGRPDLTDERFRPDPFVADARIYATGDLVRRRADGAILYLGRNDHQIKIRGMRVEPGEIEHALAGLDGVREAAVLAREDLGGPMRLVGYVAGAPCLNEEAMLARLSVTLPAHMVPQHIVTLPAFPVTANGKLDRKALPKPQIAAARGTPPQNATEARVAELFRTTLGLPEVPVREADFFTLGGDSLSALNLLLAFEEIAGRAVPLGQLFETPTVAGLAHALQQGENALAGLSPIFPLATGQGAPLVLLHPAGGLAWGYRALAEAFHARTGLPVLGVQSPVLSGAEMPDSLPTLCRHYADLIEAATDSPRLHLTGWSLGGILAQEIAVELTARGRDVGLLAALDAYPSEAWRAEPEPDPVAALRALLAIAGHDPEAHPDLDTRAKVVAFLKARESLLGALPTEVLDAVVRLVTGTNGLMRRHEHRVYDGTLLHLRAGLDHRERDLDARMWAPHAARVESLSLPCLHKDMVAPDHAQEIAALLAARI
ncbi:non-ribosomal peptide synthetase [Celeribacter indicus]|uniref:Enterobactin synthase subunit F n=1 Tax=Celeribacter indicus TaxID=1208324 RepID=A0A0B5E2Z8_9RHOB|nr:non-ribosomal peptide synthetase [Celeribacter indicus]AJE46822.1 enterobactin synthase subunit F [Celeribacter indicus]SDW81059.1 enterobactin synthetase component F [Celeribacter indicus]